jgi:hypothetical protein
MRTQNIILNESGLSIDFVVYISTVYNDGFSSVPIGLLVVHIVFPIFYYQD